MSLLKVTGGARLDGSVEVQGAKNGVLPLMAASILVRGSTVLRNCPDLSDVDAAMNILRHLGCTAERDGDAVVIDSTVVSRYDIPDALMREMRSSVIFLGPILARQGEAVLSMPGGCELGPRPIDLHLAALRAMGAEIAGEGGNIVCRARALHGGRIDLSIPSVGATENSLLAAAGCPACTTVITNAAQEPEITDLCSFLGGLGAGIHGAGTSVITVQGAALSTGPEYRVLPDRIAAATYLTAAAAAGGTVNLTGVVPAHIEVICRSLEEMGCSVRSGPESVCIRAEKRLRAARPVITKPYPGFPTDAQPPLMAASLTAEGTTVFVENIFANRYRHVSELLRMGADIRTEGRVAMVSGVESIHGAPVTATDLRGGAALVVAALGAKGVTEVSGLGHIDRGYDDIEGALRRLGADVTRL